MNEMIEEDNNVKTMTVVFFFGDAIVNNCSDSSSFEMEKKIVEGGSLLRFAKFQPWKEILPRLF